MENKAEEIRAEYLADLNNSLDFMTLCYNTAVAMYRDLLTAKPITAPDILSEMDKEFGHIPQYVGSTVVETENIHKLLVEAFKTHATKRRYAEVCKFLQEQLVSRERIPCRVFDLTHFLYHTYKDEFDVDPIDTVIAMMEKVLMGKKPN